MDPAVDRLQAAIDGRDITLVATDLDGTLLSERFVVSERTARAVARARDAGIHVVPATGRPVYATLPLLADCRLGPRVVCSNGATVVTDEGTLVRRDLLDHDIAARLVRDLRVEVPGVRFAVEPVVRDPDDADLELLHVARFETEVDFLTPEQLEWFETEHVLVDDILSVLDAALVKLIARHPDHSAAALGALVAAWLADEAHHTSSGADWVELSAFGVTKALGVAHVCDELGLTADHVIACGDNLNDVAMLGFAAVGCAMANATPALLDEADVVLPSNADHGVAWLLETLVELR